MHIIGSRGSQQKQHGEKGASLGFDPSVPPMSSVATGRQHGPGAGVRPHHRGMEAAAGVADNTSAEGTSLGSLTAAAGCRFRLYTATAALGLNAAIACLRYRS